MKLEPFTDDDVRRYYFASRFRLIENDKRMILTWAYAKAEAEQAQCFINYEFTESLSAVLKRIGWKE